MKKVIAFLMMMALSACASPEERVRQQAEREKAQCLKAGYSEDTPAFDECRFEVRSQAEQRRNERVNAFDGLQQVQSNRVHTIP